MKKKIGIVGLCMLACSILTHAQTITPQVEQRAKEIVSYEFFPACHSPFGNP